MNFGKHHTSNQLGDHGANDKFLKLFFRKSSIASTTTTTTTNNINNNNNYNSHNYLLAYIAHSTCRNDHLELKKKRTKIILASSFKK